MIIESIEHIFSISKAVTLAEELNRDDDWTYTVAEIEKNPGMARIVITDEDNYIVGNL
tara:strand:+ start:375 stop:548 length:174 start_codon:yes stop_codon:yes gene_type:complete